MIKEDWFKLTFEQKTGEVSNRLQQLIEIEKGRHPLYNQKDQGRLCTIKKELTEEIFQTIEWESDKLK